MRALVRKHAAVTDSRARAGQAAWSQSKKEVNETR